MKKKQKNYRFFYFSLAFLLVLCFDSCLLKHLKKEAQFAYRINKERVFQALRDEEIPLTVSKQLKEEAKESGAFSKRLLSYLITKETDPDTEKQLMIRLQRKNSAILNEYSLYLEAIWNDITYFPVPISKRNEKATVSYSNSWMQERTFGGKRGHEGCDVMAAIGTRGVYPVISMTDGVVEKVGWLPAGGYRIGIRSPSGGYFYYAHLFDYAKEFEEGEAIKAGTLLGFMGDSGYGETPGTVGNFPVHLHVGIYFNDKDGNEISVNPYWILRYLDDKKLVYDY